MQTAVAHGTVSLIIIYTYVQRTKTTTKNVLGTLLFRVLFIEAERKLNRKLLWELLPQSIAAENGMLI